MLLDKLFGTFTPWFFLIEFLAGGIVIIFAGHHLAKSSKGIADLTGLGQTWIGLTLLSVVTSLPEFSVNISGVVMGAPEIVAGNIFGSNVFNILIIGILDILQGRGAITKQINIRQILPAGLGIALTSIAVFAILAIQYVPLNPNHLGIFFSGLILVLFLAGNRMIFIIENKKAAKAAKANAQSTKSKDTNHPNTLRAFITFIVSAAIIVLAGIWLIKTSLQFAEYPFVVGGKTLVFGKTFVGTIVLAIITSLPELVVAISAFKMGAPNMAVANLFGSCSFNVFIFPILEPLMKGQSIFQFIDCTLLIPAVISIIMMSVAVMGLIYRSSKSYLNMGWDGMLIFFFYIVGNYLFFMANVLVPQAN